MLLGRIDWVLRFCLFLLFGKMLEILPEGERYCFAIGLNSDMIYVELKRICAFWFTDSAISKIVNGGPSFVFC